MDYVVHVLAALFLMLKFFNTHVQTSRKLHKNAYTYHEMMQNFNYQQRILNVEQNSFSLLIFGCIGGAAPTAKWTVQRVAEKLSEKKDKKATQNR